MSRQVKCLQGVSEAAATAAYFKTPAHREPSQDRLRIDLGPS